MVSSDEIDAAKSPNGGWSRAQLSAWGVSWPPPSGWRKALERGLPQPAAAPPCACKPNRKQKRDPQRHIAEMRVIRAHLRKHRIKFEGVDLSGQMLAIMQAEGIGTPPDRIASDRYAMLGWLVAILSASKTASTRAAPEKTIAEADEFYRSSDWKRARIDALIRHGRRCGCCGATPETGAVINVDHIRPLRFNWDLRLDPNNLQILCSDCNHGKGNRLVVDFRSPRSQDQTRSR